MNKSVEAAVKGGKALDRSAGAVLLLGLMVLFAGTGRLQLGPLALEFSRHAPRYVPMVAIIISCLIIFLGTAILLERHIGDLQAKLWYKRVGALVLLVVIVWSAYATFFQKPPRYSIPGWSCDPGRNIFSLKVNGQDLRMYDGRSLLAVVHPEQVDSNTSLDWCISNSWSIDIVDNSIVVELDNLLPDVRIGDKLWVELYAIPRDTIITEIKDLAYLDSINAEWIANRWTTYDITEATPDSLIAGFRQMSSSQKAYFLELTAATE